jgi:hypothetical protein
MLMQLLFTWLLILCCIFLQLRKTLLILNKVRHSSIASRTFTVLMKATTQRYRVQTHRRFSKTTQKSMRISQSLFGLGKWVMRRTEHIYLSSPIGKRFSSIVARRFSISEATNMDLFFEFKRWTSNLVRFSKRPSLCVFL